MRTGIVWYRKTFDGRQYTGGEICNGRKVFLYFDGVGACAEVWINGVLAASNPYGYTPIYTDITPYIEAENIIAVKADTSLQPFSRFYQGTGIYRNIDIMSTSPQHIDGFGVKYTYNANGEIEVRTRIRAAAHAATVWHDFGTEPNVYAKELCELHTEIISIDGAILGSSVSSHILPEFSSHTFIQVIKPEALPLWSAENPVVYHIRTKLYVNSALADDEITAAGFRTITYSAAEGLLISGAPVKLKGVCLHQDAGVFGAAVPVKEWVKKLCVLKNMGANAVRTSHHPFPREFYDVCDVMGIYVMDESFDEWKRGWKRDMRETPYGKSLYGYHQYFEQWSETDVRLMVKRDRHHPCVIMWSMGNEIPDFYYAEGVSDLKRLVRICKEEDATRPVTIGAEGQYRLPIADGLMDSLDIAGYNYVNLKHPDYYEGLHNYYKNGGLPPMIPRETYDYNN